VWIALLEKEIPFELVSLNLMVIKLEFLALNPSITFQSWWTTALV